MSERLKRIGRKLMYQGHRVKVFEDTMQLPDGATVLFDYVENRNGAGVLIVDEEGYLVFVRQSRQMVKGDSIEIPAGCMEPSDVTLGNMEILTAGDAKEDMGAFKSCALREAEEETGLIPGRLFFINYIVGAVGLFSERTAVFIGTDCSKGTLHRDMDEFMDVIRLTPEEALHYIAEGKIHDSKTILAILAYTNADFMKNLKEV